MDKYIPLEVGDIAFFMPWKDIIIKDEIIKTHAKSFEKEGDWKKVTLYEFKHIQGTYRAYKSKQGIEKALKL